MTQIKELIEVLKIVEKYKPNQDPFQPEHDCIYLNLTMDQCPEDSEDGIRLQELSCHPDFEGNDGWGMFVSC